MNATSAIAPSDRICNLVPSADTGADWTLADAAEAGLLAAAPPPPSLDLRASWWTVGDQGKTGSCVGWAGAWGVGWYVMRSHGRIGAADRLSPRYLWMGSKETDEFNRRPTSFAEADGTSLKAACEIARLYGFALEADVPFAIRTAMYLGSVNALYASNAQRKIASYINLGRDPLKWRMWLAEQGPILAGLSVDSHWMQGGTDGMLDAFDAANVYGGHAVCICGYREDGTFIVRNSWGTTWGDRGHAYVTPAYLQAAFFDEGYGMSVA